MSRMLGKRLQRTMRASITEVSSTRGAWSKRTKRSRTRGK